MPPQSVILLRHGLAEDVNPQRPHDHDRELTQEGAEILREEARGLARLAWPLDAIRTSPLPRARQTAEILADALNLTDRLVDDPMLHVDSSAAVILAHLRQLDASHVMLVGHNPALSQLASRLAFGQADDVIQLKKGMLARFKREGAQYMLSTLAPPKLLRTLGGG